MATIVVSPPVGMSVYQSTRGALSAMLGHAQQLQTAITANSITPSLVLNLLNDCVNIANFATLVEANPNLEAAVVAFWASDQQTTTTIVSNLLGVMFGATTTLNTDIQADYPKDAQGHLLDHSFGSGGVITQPTFTASQFPTTATALTAWLATVS